jgi:hypothetical protein
MDELDKFCQIQQALTQIQESQLATVAGAELVHCNAGLAMNFRQDELLSMLRSSITRKFQFGNVQTSST